MNENIYVLNVKLTFQYCFWCCRITHYKKRLKVFQKRLNVLFSMLHSINALSGIVLIPSLIGHSDSESKCAYTLYPRNLMISFDSLFQKTCTTSEEIFSLYIIILLSAENCLIRLMFPKSLNSENS